jgi:AcrR family transcriptional regulator
VGSLAERRSPGPRPKGRRRAEAILDAAAVVLVTDGHAALSLRGVAAGAGVRLGHLQYYYRSKADLVQALLARELDRAASVVEAGGRQAAGAADPVATLIEVVLDQQRRPSTVRLFGELRALAARDAAIAALVRDYYARYWRAVVGAMLTGYSGPGRARVERRAALLVATLEGLLQFRSTGDPRQLPLLGLERELVEVAGSLVRG